MHYITILDPTSGLSVLDTQPTPHVKHFPKDKKATLNNVKKRHIC